LPKPAAVARLCPAADPDTPETKVRSSAWSIAATIGGAVHPVIPAKQTLTMGRLYAAMIAGAVWINVSVPFIVQMSNGGFKHSGYGMDMPMYRF